MEFSTSTGDRRHLTWRDLPATPPTGPVWAFDPSPQASAPAFVSAAAVTRPRPRVRRRTLALTGGAAAGVIALIAVFAVANPLAATTTAPAAAPGTAAGGAAGGNGAGGGKAAANAAPTPVAPSTGGSSEPLADTAARILPSVVQIETRGGIGTGFVADGSGNILTANHVVGGSTQLTVKLQDGSAVQGTVVATDASIDTAVVRIDRTDIPALTLGDSDQVRVGQQAIAVGSPFGLDETVTAGIVSALNRSLQAQGSQLTGLIQTDAPINPGNSGGPLTDRNGVVIGINDAIASTSGQSAGVGFAVPINDAKGLLEKVQNGAVGNQGQPQTGSGQNGGGNTDPFGDLFGQGGNGSDPFGGLFGDLFGQGGNGTDPFGGLFGDGGLGDLFGQGGNGSDPNQGGSGATPNPGAGDALKRELFQWFLQNVLPQLNQGQSGAGN